MRLITALLACATICAAAPNGEPKVEMGEINGAKFRIDIPANWNGGLVMYCHGYSPIAVSYKEGALPPVLAVFTDQGYALAQSGYAAGGWAIQEAVADTEALRRHFATKYGQPKETFITGHSMNASPPAMTLAWRCAARSLPQLISWSAVLSTLAWCSITISLAHCRGRIKFQRIIRIRQTLLSSFRR